MAKQISNAQIRTIITVILTVVICVVYFLNCHGERVEVKTLPINQNKLNKDIKTLKGVNTQIDSSVVLRERKMRLDSVNLVKQLTKYKLAYLKAIKTAPDTCKTYINIIYKECEKVDSSRVNYSLKQDSTIKDLKKVNNNLKLIEQKKDSIIIAKSDSISILKQVGKRKFKNGFKLGFATGAILIETANLAPKFIRP